jgi:hypothetical protein
MKIIILGAGQVGRTAAHMLAQEKHNDVTVVDLNDDTLRELQDRLDIRTVHGHAAHPSVLARAGAEDADMLIALTDSDETNMIACQIGYTLYHTPTKIARIRSGEYIGEDRLFGPGSLAVDVRISPEQLVTEHIERLIQYRARSRCSTSPTAGCVSSAPKRRPTASSLVIPSATCAGTCRTSRRASPRSTATARASCRRATPSYAPATRSSSSPLARTSASS